MVYWIAVSAAWLTGSFGGGALLAWWFHRRDPELSFHKLWAFLTVLLSLLSLVVLAVIGL